MGRKEPTNFTTKRKCHDMKVRCPRCTRDFEQPFENYCSRCGLNLTTYNLGKQICKACEIEIGNHTLQGLTQCLFELSTPQPIKEIT